MTKLTTKFKSWFSASFRNRGKAYFQMNRVKKFTESNDHYLEVQVKGSSNYDVFLEVDDDTVYASCTCPVEGFCKHIWAVLLSVDENHKLAGARDKGVTELEFEYPEFSSSNDDNFNLAPQSLFEHYKKTDSYSLEVRVFKSRTHWGGFQTGMELIHALEKHAYEYPNGLLVNNKKLFWQKAEIANMGYPFGFEKNYNPDFEDSLKVLEEKNFSVSHIDRFGPEEEIVYHIDLQDSNSGIFNFNAYVRKKKADGDWGALRNDENSICNALSPIDFDIMKMLGAQFESYYKDFRKLSATAGSFNTLLPILLKSNRCYFVDDNVEIPLKLSETDEALKFIIKIKKSSSKYIITPLLTTTSQKSIALKDLQFFNCHGYLYNGIWSSIDLSVHKYTLAVFEKCQELKLTKKQFDQFYSKFTQLPDLPEVLLPENIERNEYTPELKKSIIFEPHHQKLRNQEQSKVEYIFEYDEHSFSLNDYVLGKQTDQGFLKRDIEAEEIAVDEIRKCNVRLSKDEDILITNKELFKNIHFLVSKHWKIKYKGKIVRPKGKLQVKVSSGIDWLELDGKLDFENTSLSLKKLLDQLNSADNLITLSDGSLGFLDGQEVNRLEKLLHLGKKSKDNFRFELSQAFIIDALLAEQPEVTFDEKFSEIKNKLANFKGLTKKTAPRSFKGKLRPYQQEGLAWLNFTQEFGLGACLADDMGLGKTVQIIALLEQRRLKKVTKPTLIVVPTSLIFNWQSEFNKFAEKITVLNYTGLSRKSLQKNLQKMNVVLTTYGILRRDIDFLKDQDWDYAILDEGQAIKNANTASAKATRLLVADHRLIMSGTPIENHLGELWSLFDFLNPGMLGSLKAFENFSAETKDKKTLEAFSKALKPMILRRKKEDVLKDLPDKTEQTLFCEMNSEQTKFYKELRDSYRRDILAKDDTEIKRGKLEILQALTRLRQAACHPGLIDPEWNYESCKLDMVIPQILEAIDEGHKVLVFSQFTKFLSLVRKKLDIEKMSYEYLDGRTRKREEKVKKFQEDENCKLFLISLKAGGTGLNLTKADYVFILDPWWNPASEAQAIDRAHRIGQTRKVFAYRVIAKDTIEEKILELQDSKRNLADSILSDDNKGLKNLTKQDLEILFS